MNSDLLRPGMLRDSLPRPKSPRAGVAVRVFALRRFSAGPETAARDATQIVSCGASDRLLLLHSSFSITARAEHEPKECACTMSSDLQLWCLKTYEEIIPN